VEEIMPDKQDRSIGELFAEFARETGTLLRQEVALAKVELTQKASRVGRNVGYLAVGAAIVYGALLALMAAVIILLANVMPWWAAALVVAVVVGIVGAVLVSKAVSALKEIDLRPQQTVETLKEDAQWAKQQIKS
jgi:uncharacterized membrane protein YqjE